MHMGKAFFYNFFRIIRVVLFFCWEMVKFVMFAPPVIRPEREETWIFRQFK